VIGSIYFFANIYVQVHECTIVISTPIKYTISSNNAAVLGSNWWLHSVLISTQSWSWTFYWSFWLFSFIEHEKRRSLAFFSCTSSDSWWALHFILIGCSDDFHEPCSYSSISTVVPINKGGHLHVTKVLPTIRGTRLYFDWVTRRGQLSGDASCSYYQFYYSFFLMNTHLSLARDTVRTWFLFLTVPRRRQTKVDHQ
jgi:hypothetical protein